MNGMQKHLKSYTYAFRGIRTAFSTDQNIRIHFVAAATVSTINYVLDVSRTDWLITLLLIGVVGMSEMLNTAIERLADRVSKEQDPLIGQAKDIAAGAVLVATLIAVVCAVIIYSPHLARLL